MHLHRCSAAREGKLQVAQLKAQPLAGGLDVRLHGSTTWAGLVAQSGYVAQCWVQARKVPREIPGSCLGAGAGVGFILPAEYPQAPQPPAAAHLLEAPQPPELRLHGLLIGAVCMDARPLQAGNKPLGKSRPLAPGSLHPSSQLQQGNVASSAQSPRVLAKAMPAAGFSHLCRGELAVKVLEELGQRLLPRAADLVGRRNVAAHHAERLSSQHHKVALRESRQAGRQG